MAEVTWVVFGPGKNNWQILHSPPQWQRKPGESCVVDDDSDDVTEYPRRYVCEKLGWSATITRDEVEQLASSEAVKTDGSR